MKHKQIELALDLDPLVETPEGYRKCTKCELVFPLTKSYFKFNRQRGKFFTQCATCARDRDQGYRNTEKGFLNDMFHGCLKRQQGRSTHRPEQNKRLLKMIHTLNTKEKLFNHWELHKRYYGYRCAYTGNILTHKRLLDRGNKVIKILSNISIDRLHPSIGYTETNTFFVCGDINSKKNNLSPKECLKIVNFCKERGRYDLL
tara:strand:- start:92 stop:697 length:606 start_codon:yes stop_codon:yes gene_type:complete